MAKKSRGQTRRYIHKRQDDTAITAGNYRKAFILFDLKAILESLAGQGEEVKITKALLRYSASGTSGGFAVQPAILVADAAIADDNAISATMMGTVDDDWDQMTAGDYEASCLGDVVQSDFNPENGNSVVSRLRFTKDVSDAVRRASTMLVRSALLTTNPEACIVLEVFSDELAATIQSTAVLQIDYQVVAKPLRMLA
jgi:hypothetical protein